MKIIDLFPTPIGIFHNTDTSEHDFIYNSKFKSHPYYDDFVVSTDSSFLTSKKDYIPKVYNFIQSAIKQYAEATLATTQPLKLTQSWLTKHDGIPQFTFPHKHQNSIVSGCYYVLATEQDAGINFHRDADGITKFIKWEQEENLSKGNKYAWERVEINVETGILVLFPSWVTHSVSGTIQQNARCSLAFNTWFDGPIGSEDAFTLL